MMGDLKCRVCGTKLENSMIDLGLSPVANAYINKEDLDKGQMYFPLHAYVCSECYLVQLGVFESPGNIFKEYAYFSSYSTSWLEHCKLYCKTMVDTFQLNKESSVIEIASNDGYLLQYFKELGIKTLGIEPAENVAEIARAKGIDTISEFFGEKCASALIEQGITGDIVVANNVLAHVPNINDLIKGIKLILNREGVFTAEFPHLLELMKNKQFDTIYHEHFSYFSFKTMKYLLNSHGLDIFNVEKLGTHGGSLRIYATHNFNNYTESESVRQIISEEESLKIDTMEFYTNFQTEINQLKIEILRQLSQLKLEGKTIVGYGAPAKGNTMLNFCGIGKEMLDYTVDLSPHKQGKYLPGSQIPIYEPSKIMEMKPEYVLILPWNLKDEISKQLQDIRSWGGKFMVVVPDIEIW